MTTVTATGTSSPIQVPGLAAGNWKFNVAAVNSAGTSAQSTSSAVVAITTPVTPTSTHKWSAWTGGVGYENSFLQTMTGSTNKANWYGRNYLPHDITQIDNPSGSYQDWKNAGYSGMILGTPLAGSGMTCAQVAAGNADSHILAFIAKFNTDFPNGTGIVELGWEPNIGNEYPWCAQNAPNSDANYKAAFDHFAGLVHAHSSLLVDYTVSGQSNAMSAAGTPAVSSVDIYGIDAYDNIYGQGGAPFATRWNKVVNGSGGQVALAAVINQAKANGKKWSVNEWGVSPTSAGGGGDDPSYISNMIHLMKTGNDLQGLITTNYPGYSDSYYSASYDILNGYPNSVAAYKTAYST